MDKRIIATIVIGAAVLTAYIYSLGYLNGHTRGMADERELSKRVECEIEYGRTAQSLIPGDCLKYFKDK